MNKRQKKKEFKKKYGFNPPQTKAVIEMDWSDIVYETVLLGNRTGEILKYITNVIIPSMVKTIESDMKETSDAIKNIIDKVENMSDEEWKEYKKVLNDDQMALLEYIRMKWIGKLGR